MFFYTMFFFSLSSKFSQLGLTVSAQKLHPGSFFYDNKERHSPLIELGLGQPLFTQLTPDPLNLLYLFFSQFIQLSYLHFT